MTESRLMAGAVEIHDLSRTRESFRGPAQPLTATGTPTFSKSWRRSRGVTGLPDQFLRILAQVGPRAPDLVWTFLKLDGYGELDSEAIEQEIYSARQGLILSWDALPDFIRRFEQFVWVVLVGCVDRSDIPRVDKDDLDVIPKPPELYREAEIVIEQLDTSWWRVYAKDDDLLERIRHEFRDVRPVDDDPPA
jgi:hypothetical protein